MSCAALVELTSMNPVKSSKRALPIGLRCRKRHVSIAPATDAIIRRRITQANAAGYPTDFSKEIARAVEEAEGNNRRIRSAVSCELTAMLAGVEMLRPHVISKPAAGESFALIKAAADRLRAVVMPPASRTDGAGVAP